MRKWLLMAFLSASVALPAAEDGQTMPAEAFLAKARRPTGDLTWDILKGEVTHRRRDQDELREVIRCAVRFYPARVAARVRIGQREEYAVGQSFDENDCVITRLDDGAPDKALLARFGLRPEDLTLTFLFWKFREEREQGRAGGQPCRVFALTDPKTKESVNVFIAIKYFFPLRVEWFKPGQKEAYRSLEIKSFREEKGIYLPSDIMLLGPGWRTKVDFNDNRAGVVKDGVPADLFETPAPNKQAN